MVTLSRILSLGFRNFWRNRWLTLGAALLMTLTLTMVAVSLVISFVVRDASTAVQSKISLTIFFRDDSVPDAKIQALSDRLKTLSSVQGIDFVSKEDALSIFQRLKINSDIKKPVNKDFNPLPRSLNVRVNNVANVGTLSDQLSGLDKDKIICSDCVSYKKNQEIVDKIVAATKMTQEAGWLLSIFFGLVAIFNVSNIIRLTIHARSDEIEIMRYVGASNWFVRGPFMVEGVLYGLIGTVGAMVLLLLIAQLGSSYLTVDQLGSLSSAFPFLSNGLIDYVWQNIWPLIWAQLAIGVLLGTIVSFVSVRRYLKV